MKTKQEFLQLINDHFTAGFQVLHVVTTEPFVATEWLRELAQEMGQYNVVVWDRSRGYRLVSSDDNDSLTRFEPLLRAGGTNPVAAMAAAVADDTDKTFYVMLNLDNFYEPSPELRQIVENATQERLFHYVELNAAGQQVGTRRRMCIVLTPRRTVHRDLKHLVRIVELPLPEEKELSEIAKAVGVDDATDIGKLCLGLSRLDAENVVSKALARNRKEPVRMHEEIRESKADILAQTGFLRYVSPDQIPELGEICGFDNAVEKLRRLALGLTDAGRKAKLDPPRGAVFLGLPGSGKSSIAKLVPAVFREVTGFAMPAIWVNTGRLFSKYVGESAENLETMFAILESLKGCIAIFDEFEKTMGGAFGQGTENDGGTRSETAGRLLQWMAEERRYTVPMVTMNTIRNIPPEFFRRFDATFYVDFPDDETRIEIFNVHAKKRATEFAGTAVELSQLSVAMRNFTGSEIEQVVSSAMAASLERHGKVVLDYPVVLDAIKDRAKNIMAARHKRELDAMVEFCRDTAIPVAKAKMVETGRSKSRATAAR